MGCAQSSNVVGEGGGGQQQKSTAAPVGGAPESAVGANKPNDSNTPPTTSTEGEEKAVVTPKPKPPKCFSITCSHKDTKPDERHISQFSGSAVLGDLKVRYGCYSQRGKDADDATKPNQDSYSVLLQQQQQEPKEGATDDNPKNDYIFWGVYDGHGPQGEPCSQFVGETLPNLIQQHVRIATNKQRRQQQQRSSREGGQEQPSSSSAPATTICLSKDEIEHALHQAHTECNDDLHMSQINDSYSGTTSISIYMHSDNRITVSNVGDSRAVLGTRMDPSGNALVGVPLSKDQTPHRPEEAQRCIRKGARILSFGQINPCPDDDPDEDDPPRVWSKKGKFPGTAFTRSFGDAIAEQLGVYAEPEVMTVKLCDKEKLLVLASDGVFDVLDNQQVVDLICQSRKTNTGDDSDSAAVADPLVACRTIIERSHQEWLLNEGNPPEDQENYDDMTIICVFISSANDKEDDDFWTAIPPPTPQPTMTEEGALPPTAGAEENATNDDHEHHVENEEDGGEAIPRKKRVRQKTLRNLEEMADADAGGGGGGE